MEKLKLEKLDGTQFTFELHEINNSKIPYENAIGYNDSKNVPILQKTNFMCVMFFTDEKGEFWFHIPYVLFRRYYEVDEIYKEKNIDLDEMIEEDKKNFLMTIGKFEKKFDFGYSRNVFKENLNSVSADKNKDGLMHFIYEPDCEGWWAYKLNDVEENPNNVRVVNQVGGYHYTDFIKADLQKGYKFASAKSRMHLPDID